MISNPFSPKQMQVGRVLFLPAKDANWFQSQLGVTPESSPGGTPGSTPGSTPGAGGLSEGNINNLIQGIAGILGSTTTMVGNIIQSGDRVRIAELQNDMATRLASISNQLGIGGQTESQRQDLMAQQNQIASLLPLLRQLNAPPAQDNTMMYVALAAAAALVVYMASKPSAAPPSAPMPIPVRRNPRRTRRSR